MSLLNTFPAYVRKRFSLTIATALASCLLCACQYQQKSVKEAVLVYCSEGSPQTFNPQFSTSGTTFDASSRTIYNRLVEFRPDGSFIEPALAESWDISSDGKVYTFYLRKGVTFHTTPLFTPTRPFNADDVLFSFNKQRQPSHAFHNTSRLSYRYFDSMGLNGLIKQIEKLDEFTVRFTLTRPESPFLSTLAMDFASILSAEYASTLSKIKQPELIDRQPVGTGPFQLIRYQPDAYIRYKAHPDYWQGKQKLQSLVFAITPDPSLRLARLVAGECDIMANPLPSQIKATKRYKDIEVMKEAGLNIAYLAFNTQKAPFNNDKVRLALNYAVNKEDIINAVYRQTATMAKNPIPPKMWSYNKATLDYPFDPAKARRLLAQAGYENGFKMSISTMSAQRSYNPDAKKMAELIQHDFREIGVDVEIQTYEYSAFLSGVRKGEHHSAILGWTSDNGDPDNFFSPLLSCAGSEAGTNSAFWCDQEFSDVVQQARAKSDLAKRTELYIQAQQLFKQASPWVPIAHATQHILLNKRVKNFHLLTNGGVYFGDVELTPHKLADEGKPSE